jgi:uncharacterized protein
MLGGARQSGKTTLVSEMLGFPARNQFTFDHEAMLAAAEEDPVGFVESLPRPAVVDEFQRAGRGFLLAVKQAADRDRSRGQLLLTGSTSYLADKNVSETLAGRTGRLTLWPLSAGERRGVRETFVDRCFEPESWPPTDLDAMDRTELVDQLLQGGYPEVVTERLETRARMDWFDSYVHDVVSREALRPLAEVRMVAELRAVLRLLAGRTGHELVVSDLASDAGLSRATAANYVTLLEALHLVVLLPAWATSVTTRAKRHPKVVLVDTGLCADLVQAGTDDFMPGADGRMAGGLFESFVVTEVLKQATWSRTTVDVAHFRDRYKAEVDLVIEERRTGRLACVEVKLTSTPKADHARHLAMLRDRLGDGFTVGLVIHAGEKVVPLGERLWAVPVTALWRSD